MRSGSQLSLALKRAKAADVDRPQVQRRFALHDPLGERLACAAGRGDAHRVEAAADVEVGKARRRADDEVVVGSERLGAVVELLDLRLRSDGTRVIAFSIRISNASQLSGSS
jgi:hypothetical protein